MIFDLAERSDDHRVAADICIVGGGIAGLIAADRMRRQGRSVLVLESGGRSDPGGEHPLNAVVNCGQMYHGASQGRARGLGGTSSRWGGALIPFLEQDFAARPHVGVAGWPIELQDLAPYVTEVEQLFGVDATSFEENFLDQGPTRGSTPRFDSDVLLRFAKWPGFRRRNVATLLRDRLETDPGLSVWLNATVVSFDADTASGRLGSVTARALNGRSLRADARHFILAAGAIESTRLLLLLQRQTEEKAFEDCTVLGRGFHDHVSTAAASIVVNDPLGLNRLAGFRFHQGTMRSMRFELSPRAQADEGAASSFGHIGFETVRTLQRSGRLDLAKAFAVAGDLPYLFSAAWWRFANGQLLWPRGARCSLHIVGEQLPRDDNRIALCDEPDALGVPKAAITWTTGSQEMSAIAAFARRFGAYWERHGMSRIGTLDWRISAHDNVQPTEVQANDVFHPGGTTRMGLNRKTSVVDGDLSCHAVSNVWVLSTSAFPTGASANPTLMLMAFAMRLADRIGR
jgi:choline dehydrogenase-like flavoprotein